MDRLPPATDEQYKEFREGAVWHDMLTFMEECIELNRDILERLKSFQEGFRQESDDALRGRNWQIRDLIAYVNDRADS